VHRIPKSTLPAAARAGQGSWPRLREATFDDYAQIAALESRYGLEAKTYRQWAHLWAGNPACRYLPHWKIGWVIEDNGRIVGSVGNIPLLYEFEGRRILAASGRSQVADPAYRSASLLLLDRVINQPGIDLYLNNTMTLPAAAAFEVFACPKVPSGLWDQSAFWITNQRGFIESVLCKRKYRMTRLLSYPASAASFLKDWVTQIPLQEGDTEVQAFPGFDQRFEKFWMEFRANHPRVLLAVRTQEVLEWHFMHAVLDQRLWVAAAMHGPKIAAYAIFDRQDNPEIGLKRVRLVDFVSLDGSTALLEPLLAWAVRKCRAEGIHMLESVGRWLEGGEFMEAAAPHRRKLSTWTFFYLAKDAALARALTDRHAWMPSLFDGNASL
jgi:hypothetical protein